MWKHGEMNRHKMTSKRDMYAWWRKINSMRRKKYKK